MHNFAKTLRCLFVEGWITVDPRSSPSASTGAAGVVGDESAPPKTVTQIIFEQLEDMTYIRYGTQSKAFWKPTSKDECAAALADMASIAEDTLHRLDADSAGLYVDLEALNIQAWRTTQREKHARLMQAARHLCEAFNIPYSLDQWVRIVKWVRRVRSRRGDADSVDNRILWAAALAASRGTKMEQDMEVVSPLISFVAAMMDGTGSVERFLGAHGSFLEAHEGGGESEAAEVCLEVAREGPSTEAEMFTKVGEVLRLTDFSRSCARLWRTLHGRRFACYKERKTKA